jgi:transglutaminase superfamily protein
MIGRVRRLAYLLRRLDLPTLRAAWWAARAMRGLRRDLRSLGLRARVPVPPPLPADAVRGVRGIADLSHATCLERSLLLQRWLVAHGQAHDVLVGVGPSARDFEAHAWIEGYDPDEAGAGFEVLTRVPA